MTEYSRIAKGSFTSTGAAKAIYLPFLPDYVELVNYTAATTPANHGVPFAKWDIAMGQGFAVEQVFNATPVLTTDIVIANGISTFSAGLSLQYGARKQIESATKADPVVFTVTAHGYSVGDIVVFEGLYQTSTTGMPQMCGMTFAITAVSANTFTVKWNANQSNYALLTGSPTGAYVKKVLYPFLYAPGISYVEAITTGTTTTIVTTAPHNLVVGSEVALRIPAAWGTTQLNSLPNSTTPGSPVYGYVVSVTNSTTVVLNINSTGYTAYNSNQTVASVPGMSFPQMLAVGDVNTGGVAISSGSALYPSPSVNGVSTINGPAISGSFVNNTRMGFLIDAGAGSADASSVLVGANGNVIYWRAIAHDYVAS